MIDLAESPPVWGNQHFDYVVARSWLRLRLQVESEGANGIKPLDVKVLLQREEQNQFLVP